MVKLTQKDRQSLISDYKQEVYSIKELAVIYDLDISTIYKILRDNGVELKSGPRRPRKSAKTAHEVICSKCKAKGHVKGSKFCYRCGSDIRSPKHICRDNIDKVLPLMNMVPDTARDALVSTLLEAQKLLAE